ncbi:MAG: nicotinate-nucleotide--dimethylbenzimidazole phosphoribosyltransferase [Pseudomonadota bacterium]
MTDSWLQAPAAKPSTAHRDAALARQAQLTKPPGSLGLLEAAAVELAALQGVDAPSADRVHIAIFAGDHGVAAEKVSAFPQEVTAQMVANFAAGGAAISVLARELGARFSVVDVGTVEPIPGLPGVTDRRVAAGTANLAAGPAMSHEQLLRALDAGREQVDSALAAGCDLFIGGEMGIANTTAATALGCALTGGDLALMTGPGTGLDSNGVRHKMEVLARSLTLNTEARAAPLTSLQAFGGFEIAALTGAYLHAAQRGLPVVVDGFICTAAALAAARILPGARAWMLFSHQSQEPGHQALLEALDAEPLLDLAMRLGEGSGAATAVPLLRLACALHNGMHTFADAGVSDTG